ncbi:MAG: ABC transporter permease subunit [Opitutales bacterium]|nr:ABC transporter permease subunit [Opitutales bacterium]MBT5816072.1 ABC transporter permease subunit [Opitutales bacterium]MBT6381127.1 ABC transporter permease subunit [Opitutales bacterium]MBT6769615.1 ABC transporter permease subunit [Opitutales bacterium]MDG2254333.1 ABC transporter permease subunit [Opitutaceae bacterium]
MRLNPLTAKKLNRFRQIKRGYYSFLIIAVLVGLSAVGELLINSRALVVEYEGSFYFPTYGGMIPGETFGLDYSYETNYRDLKEAFSQKADGNWVLMPFVPYNSLENNEYEGLFKPGPPSLSERHILGTDTTGRDIFARLFFGMRIAILFSAAFLVLTYLVGIAIGCLMGYFGGVFDLVGQRLIEIWSNMPFLYVVIIVFSVVPSSLSNTARILILLMIMVAFSWMGMTYYMRTGAYKEKARDYVAAVEALGAGPGRIIFRHIIPNTLATIVTFMPFTIVGAITAVTALDYLGFGLPPPTPSLGELLKQGTDNLTTAPWIVSSSFVALVLLLTLVAFVGEAIREAFDPKKFTVYK